MKKLKTNILMIISILLICVSLYFDLNSRYSLNVEVKFIIYILSAFLAFIDMKLKNRKETDEVQKEKNRNRSIAIIFTIYIIFTVTLLLLDGSYRRIISFQSNIKLFSKEHFEIYSNIIPFKTIFGFIQRYFDGTINANIVIMNIIGNLVAFAPFGVFLPLLFKNKINNIVKFTLVMIGIVFVVEFIQFITLCGAFDVDDIILNVLGSIIVYAIMKFQWMKKLVEIILK